LEAALKSLTPKAARIDPVTAAYSAGQRSASRELLRWRFAAAAMAVISIGSWVLPAGQNVVGNKNAAVVVAIAPEAPAVPEQSVISLQRVVWEKGVESLTPVQPAPIKDIRIDEIISTQKGKS
jgi:hypothetical protein